MATTRRRRLSSSQAQCSLLWSCQSLCLGLQHGFGMPHALSITLLHLVANNSHHHHDKSWLKVNWGGVFFLGIFFIFFREFFSDSAFLLWLLFCFSASAALLLLLFFCFCCSFAFAAFLLLLLFRFCCSFAFAAFFAFVAFLLLLPFCFCCLFAFVALLLPCAFFVFCVLRALCALCAKAVGRLARLHALSWFHFLRARFFGFALRAFRLFHAGVKFREGCGHAKLTHPFVGKAGVKFREGCCHFNLTHPFCWQGEPPEGKI